MSSQEIKDILADEGKLASVCQSVFETFDANSNGFIEENELKAAVAQFSGDSGAGDVQDDDIKEALDGLD